MVSSTGIDPDIVETYQAYRLAGNGALAETMNLILNKYGVDAEAKEGTVDIESVVKILQQGEGVLIRVGTKNHLYAENDGHWIVLSDIRPSKLDSEIGYDIYALVSKDGDRGGKGWQQIETVVENLGSDKFYYIDENKKTNSEETAIELEKPKSDEKESI